jgi:hypothetical protein
MTIDESSRTISRSKLNVSMSPSSRSRTLSSVDAELEHYSRKAIKRAYGLLTAGHLDYNEMIPVARRAHAEFIGIAASLDNSE